MTAVLVWVHRPERNTWCVLRRATGGRTIFLCLDWIGGNVPVHVLTNAPHNSCPACEIELRAGTPGAAVAVEPAERPDVQTALAVSRTVTPDLRRPAVELDVEQLFEDDRVSAFDVEVP